MKLAGWGRYPVAETGLAAPRDEAALRILLAEGPAIARGLGRAYGDSALGAALTLDTRHFNRMHAFDPDSGQLVAEAGVRLSDILAVFLPRGWFPAITPGTKFVTLGGMIAADVHGKNHHRAGSMAACVDWVEVMGADGAVSRAAPGEPLFEWTLGGMGLTGVILRAAIRLQPVETGWIRQRVVAAPNLDAALAALAEADADATYSVAWIDCVSAGRHMGRSLLMLGEHATRGEIGARPPVPPPHRAPGVPLDAPGWLLNRATVRAFNAAYYHWGARRAGEGLVDWDAFFYPLDAVADWNRIYGRRGLVQFQCALPPAAAREGLHALLAAIAASGEGSFLAVLKRFGPGRGGLSFPIEGVTLALDFRATPRALALQERLDAIALDHGGRFYLAKDARASARTFARAEPRLDAFRAMRAEWGCAGRFASRQSERLGL